MKIFKIKNCFMFFLIFSFIGIAKSEKIKPIGEYIFYRENFYFEKQSQKLVTSVEAKIKIIDLENYNSFISLQKDLASKNFENELMKKYILKYNDFPFSSHRLNPFYSITYNSAIEELKIIKGYIQNGSEKKYLSTNSFNLISHENKNIEGYDSINTLYIDYPNISENSILYIKYKIKSSPSVFLKNNKQKLIFNPFFLYNNFSVVTDKIDRIYFSINSKNDLFTVKNSIIKASNIKFDSLESDFLEIDWEHNLDNSENMNLEKLKYKKDFELSFKNNISLGIHNSFEYIILNSLKFDKKTDKIKYVIDELRSNISLSKGIYTYKGKFANRNINYLKKNSKIDSKDLAFLAATILNKIGISTDLLVCHNCSKNNYSFDNLYNRIFQINPDTSDFILDKKYKHISSKYDTLLKNSSNLFALFINVDGEYYFIDPEDSFDDIYTLNPNIENNTFIFLDLSKNDNLDIENDSYYFFNNDKSSIFIKEYDYKKNKKIFNINISEMEDFKIKYKINAKYYGNFRYEILNEIYNKNKNMNFQNLSEVIDIEKLSTLLGKSVSIDDIKIFDKKGYDPYIDISFNYEKINDNISSNYGINLTFKSNLNNLNFYPTKNQLKNYSYLIDSSDKTSIKDISDFLYTNFIYGIFFNNKELNHFIIKNSRKEKIESNLILDNYKLAKKYKTKNIADFKSKNFNYSLEVEEKEDQLKILEIIENNFPKDVYIQNYEIKNTIFNFIKNTKLVFIFGLEKIVK